MSRCSTCKVHYRKFQKNGWKDRWYTRVPTHLLLVCIVLDSSMADYNVFVTILGSLEEAVNILYSRGENNISCTTRFCSTPASNSPVVDMSHFILTLIFLPYRYESIILIIGFENSSFEFLKIILLYHSLSTSIRIIPVTYINYIGHSLWYEIICCKNRMKNRRGRQIVWYQITVENNRADHYKNFWKIFWKKRAFCKVISNKKEGFKPRTV